MRIYINLFFFGLLFLTACKSNKTPDGIIPEKKMVDIMTEVHIVDGTLYTVAQSPDTLHKYGMDRYLLLFKKYNTDTLQFKKSLEYYTFRPKLIDEMYDQVTINLKDKTDSLNKIAKANARADSIKRVKLNKQKTDSINRVNKLNSKKMTCVETHKKGLRTK